MGNTPFSFFSSINHQNRGARAKRLSSYFLWLFVSVKVTPRNLLLKIVEHFSSLLCVILNYYFVIHLVVFMFFIALFDLPTIQCIYSLKSFVWILYNYFKASPRIL